MSKRRKDDRFAARLGREHALISKNRQWQAQLMLDYLAEALRFFGVKKVVAPFQSHEYGFWIGEPVLHPALPTELPVGLIDGVNRLFSAFPENGIGTLTFDVATCQISVQIDSRDHEGS